MPLVLIKSDPKAREKPCLRCGYSLRRIGDSRNCPECGLSVWVSLNQNDSLDWSRPDWLRMISVGATVMAGAQGMLMVAAGVVVAGGMWGDAWLMSWIVGFYLMALGAGMIVMGMPERRYPDRFKGYRWFLVVCGGLSGLLGLGIAAMAAAGRAM